MSAKRSTGLVGILAAMLIILAIATIVLLAFIPREAALVYGQPFAGLSPWDRLVLSIQLLRQQDELLQPVNPLGSPVTFTIDPGEPVGSVARRMVSAGLIPHAGAWVDYLVYAGLDTKMMAGTFQLDSASSPLALAWALQDPDNQQVPFAILPGWRLEEIAASLPTSGLSITPQDFLEIASATAPGGLNPRLPLEVHSLEGYLLPESYTVVRSISLPGLLAILLDRFSAVATPDLELAFAARGLNLDQAVRLASIVQREAIQAEEMPVIASVFLNRLAAGMPLESDPTVQYALGYDAALGTWWKVPLGAADLSIESPYNTYRVGGLPPAPICNPGREALWAVAQPADTTYFFFRAACDGSGGHVFSETYQQHLEHACP